ncbi:MAG: TonB-dependent receptor [Sandaracinus sp.]
MRALRVAVLLVAILGSRPAHARAQEDAHAREDDDDRRAEPRSAAPSPAGAGEGRGEGLQSSSRTAPLRQDPPTVPTGPDATDPPETETDADAYDDDNDLLLYSVRGVAERPIAAGSELDPTASATVLSMDARPRAVETLDETLLDAPGARTQRTGAFGGFTTLSLRGADAQQTSVLLGEIPIASPDGSAFDLGSIPTWLLSRVEVYRGGAPVWLGAGSIGGVLRLVPRDEPGQHLSASGSYGSFDLAQGRAAASAGDDRFHVTTAAGLTSFGGRFPYRDDRRTALDPTDDIDVVRQGADYLEGAAMLHARGRVDETRIEGAALFTERTGGFSPPPTRYDDDLRSRRTTTRILGGASALYQHDDTLRLQLAAGLGVERRHVSDPDAQVGQLPREADDLLLRFTLRGAGTLRVLDALDLTLVLTYAHERLDPSDVLRSTQPASSARDGAALALEGRIFGTVDTARYEIRPSVRGEILDARLFDLAEGHLGDAHGSTLALPTGRLGVVLEPIGGVALAGSAWAASRAPSLVELFGDRTYLVGNAGLRPETSYGGDLGLVLSGTLDALEGTLDVRGFAQSTSDLVRYVRTDQFQYTPQNVASALTAGAEASLALALPPWLRSTTAFSYLYAVDTSPGTSASGRTLPLRAPVSVYTRLSGGLSALGPIDRIELYADLDYVAPSYADPANLTIISGRLRFGAGLSVQLLDRRVALEVVVRDLADARGVDVLGLPLAGRSVIGTLTVRE